MANSEDWNAETTRNPENNFSMYATQSQSDRRPKTAFLRYVRVVRVRAELNSHQISEHNFQQFKNRLFATEYKRRYEPSPPLARRNF